MILPLNDDFGVKCATDSGLKCASNSGVNQATKNIKIGLG